MEIMEHRSTVTNDYDRVRAHTDPEILAQIDHEIDSRIKHFATLPKAAISKRIDELDQEWDIERTLEVNGSCIGLTGVILGATVNKKWFWLTTGVLGFCLQHALQGWCPPIHFFRKMGVRTQNEIDREKYALKALRGDFDASTEEAKSNPAVRAEEILWAVRA